MPRSFRGMHASASSAALGKLKKRALIPTMFLPGGDISETDFHALNALPVAIYMTDADGRLTYFNPAAVKLSGRTPQVGIDRWCIILENLLGRRNVSAA